MMSEGNLDFVFENLAPTPHLIIRAGTFFFFPLANKKYVFCMEGNSFEIDFGSPRFKEACARSGILQDELLGRELESFNEVGIEESVQQVKFEHFERKRQEKMRIVLEMRDSILKEEEMKKARILTNSETKTDLDEEALLTKERAELKRIKHRQKQELQQLLAFEMKISQQRKENEEKMKREAEAKEEQRRLREKRLIEEEQRRVRKEKERKKKEEEEEKSRRKMMEKEARAAKLQNKLDQEKEEQARRLAREKELERTRKQQQRQEETRRLFELQQRQLMLKKQKMDRKEEERLQLVAKQREEAARQHVKKLAEQRNRVAKALENQQRLLHEQREEFLLKEKAATERQNAFEAKRNQERLEQKRKALQKKEEIVQTIAQMEANQRSKAEATIRKRKEQERAVAQRARQMRSQNAAKEELMRLREQDRLELIERKKRMEEHKRRRILQKLDEEEEKTKKLREQRQRIAEQREHAKLKAKLEKKAILEAFEQMQVTGKLELPKDIEIDLNVASGDQGLPTINDKSSRPQSASPKKKAFSPLQTQTQRPKSAEKKTSEQEECFEPVPPTEEPAVVAIKPSTSRVICEGGQQLKQPKTTIRKTKKRKEVSVARLRKEIEKVKREQNEFLLDILQEEQQREKKREDILMRAKSSKRRAELDKQFQSERARASERILAITKEHEAIMSEKFHQLEQVQTNS